MFIIPPLRRIAWRKVINLTSRSRSKGGRPLSWAGSEVTAWLRIHFIYFFFHLFLYKSLNSTFIEFWEIRQNVPLCVRVAMLTGILPNLCSLLVRILGIFTMLYFLAAGLAEMSSMLFSMQQEDLFPTRL